MLTLTDAKRLTPGDTLMNTDGKRWKVNGAVQTWKTDDSRIRVPLKHGLYAYGSLDTEDFTDGVCDWVSIENARFQIRDRIVAAEEGV